MSKRITYYLTLDDLVTTIKLPPPCTYCGDPVEEDEIPWETEHTFSVKGRGEVKFTLEVPYCRKHKEEPKPLATSRSIAKVLWIILYIAALINIWRFVFVEMSGARLSDALVLWTLLAAVSFAFIYVVILIFTWIAQAIMSVFKSDLRGYPYSVNFLKSKSHWGLKTETISMINNTIKLKLIFSNPDSARRFKVAYPEAYKRKLWP